MMKRLDKPGIEAFVKTWTVSILAVFSLVLCSCSGAGVKGDGMGTLDFRKVIKEAKDKVFPAVVYIKVLKESHEGGKKITQEVSGSGVLISADGEALTNWHVVDKEVEVRCLLYDGRAFDAKVLGTDKEMDLALIKLQPGDQGAPENLPFAEIGESSTLKEGDFVMAMGAPWGLSRSVSMGIISCTKRYLEDESEYSLWLQTDASISPGNSGGPLINTEGRIIGINTLGVMSGGDMGFSIPSDSIRLFLPQLREHGKIDWSYTGLQLQPLKNFNKNIYFDAAEGVIVAGTDPNSPASKAGLKSRDRIIALNDAPLNAITEEDLPGVRRILGSLHKEEMVKLTIIRDGEQKDVEMTLREKGKVEGEELDCPRWDFTVKAVNQFDNPDLYFYKKKGVFIFGIKYPGNAANSGLSEQDIIVSIDNENVESLDDVSSIHKRLIDNVDTKYKVLVKILRNGLLKQYILNFQRDFEKE